MSIYRRGSAEVSNKADSSPVTEADLASHRVLAKHLAHLLLGCQVVSEEDPASLDYRQSAGRFWLIDPLDGTNEFIARNGEFTVSIALIKEGRSTLGVMYAPAIDALYWGGAGLGAFRCMGDQTAVINVASAAKGHVCRVAEGEADIYPRLAPTCEWGTAAAQAVLEGAGGAVVDLNGQPLLYGKLDVLNPYFIATRDTALIPA